MTTVDATRLRMYLLGELGEDEASVVETRLVGSDDVLEELRATEDELIEDYLRGDLPPAERTRFEAHFLASPARRARLAFLDALLQGRDGAREPMREAPDPRARRRRLTAGFAAAAVLALLAVRGLLTTMPQAPDAVPVPLAASGGVRHTGAPRAEAIRLRTPSSRSGEQVPLIDAGNAAEVTFEVPLDPGVPGVAHRARIVGRRGDDAFVSPWQQAGGDTLLRVVVPTRSLATGRLVLVLEADTGTQVVVVEAYAFQARR